jgi:C-1 hydroxylase
MMSNIAEPAENKALFRRFVDCWNRRDTEGMRRCWSPDLVHHGRTGEMRRDHIQAVMAGFMRAFPDLSFRIEQLVAEGDIVAARMTATATHLEDFAGVRATGKKIQVSVMGQVRIEDGRIAEHWNVMDELHLMRQLGLQAEGLLDPVTAL